MVNNVETFTHVARIVANGHEWFREAGTDSSPGTMLFTVVGDQDPRVAPARRALMTALF